MGHHVAARHQVHLLIGEQLPQALQVRGVGDVHRDLVGEQVHMEVPGDGQVDDLPADQVGLGLLGPGELVHRQIDLKAQVPDGVDDALVGQGEGVEGAGEEGDLLGPQEGEGAVVQPPQGDEPVDVGQGGRPVEEGHGVVLDGGLLHQEQELAVAQGEQVGLLLHGEDVALKEQVAGDQQGLLPHGGAVVGQTLEEEAQQLLPPVLIALAGLGEPLPVGGVVLEEHADGVQRPGHRRVVGGAQQGLQPQHLLVQLAGVQVQGGLAQVLGDVLGDLVLAHLQALAQLHHHLVALVPAQQGQDAHQGGAGVVADHHPLGHLDQVGEVGADVEDVLHHAVLHLVPEELHAHRLHPPVGGVFQVVQKHLAGDVLVVEDVLVVAHVLPGPEEDAVLEEGDGQAAGGDGPGQLHNPLELGVVPPEGALRRAQELEGGGLHPGVPGLGPVAGKLDDPAPHLGRKILGGQVPGRVQQGEGGVLVLVLRPVEVAQEGPHKAGDVRRAGVLQHGVHHQLQGVADVAALLLGGLVVGVDDHVQVLLPQGEGHLRRRVALHVVGELLAVDQVEQGDDPADEVGRLAADVALPVDQQLIEEGEGLGLLAHRQVGEVLLEDVQIGPQLLPVLGGAGGLDDVAELALVGEHVHHADVVSHGQEDQALHRLVGAHEGGVLVGSGSARPAGQVHIHPQGAHVVLKVVELAVDELVPAALAAVHVVQLGQNDLEGLVQGVEDGDLLSLLVPVLLGAEVGVDEAQGLHRQGLQLQVPGGVVGCDVADIAHVPLQQPLVGVVVVEVGHPLPGAAAVLADVVGGGGPGDEGQVDVHPGGLESPGGGHGDVVDPGDVAQRAEGGDLLAQAHELVDILGAEVAEEALILPAAVAALVLLGGEELEVHQGVEGHDRPLLIQKHLEDGEIKPGAVLILRGVGGKIPLRVQNRAHIPVAEGQPALLGHRGELGQDGGAHLQHLPALQTAADGQQLGELLRPAGGAQQLQGGLFVLGEGELLLR